SSAPCVARSVSARGRGGGSLEEAGPPAEPADPAAAGPRGPLVQLLDHRPVVADRQRGGAKAVKGVLLAREYRRATGLARGPEDLERGLARAARWRGRGRNHRVGPAPPRHVQRRGGARLEPARGRLARTERVELPYPCAVAPAQEQAALDAGREQESSSRRISNVGSLEYAPRAPGMVQPDARELAAPVAAGAVHQRKRVPLPIDADRDDRVGRGEFGSPAEPGAIVVRGDGSRRRRIARHRGDDDPAQWIDRHEHKYRIDRSRAAHD